MRPLQTWSPPTEIAPTLWCVPATLDLAGAEIELTSQVAREYRLQRALEAFLAPAAAGSVPDYVFIDCPPSLGLLTLNALVAGAEVLIPIQCEYYALEGLAQLLNTVELVQSHLNPISRSPRCCSPCTTAAPGWPTRWRTRCATTSRTWCSSP